RPRGKNEISKHRDFVLSLFDVFDCRDGGWASAAFNRFLWKAPNACAVSNARDKGFRSYFHEHLLSHSKKVHAAASRHGKEISRKARSVFGDIFQSNDGHAL